MDRARTQKNGSAHIAGIEHLVRLLMRLKRQGCQSVASDEVWNDVPLRASGRKPKHVPSVQSGKLLALRQSLDEAKLYLVVADDVRDLIGKRIRFLSRACTPLVLENGIKTLPDEVLSQVFEAGHLSTGGYTFAKRVSHVSHRFRQVALQTPLIWSRISGSYSDRQVQVFASRSGQIGLDISLDGIDRSITKRLNFLLGLSPYPDRWSSLSLYHESVGRTMQQMALTNLPRLQVLYLHCDINLSSWNLPLLSRVCTRRINFISWSTIQLQLTSFELVVDGTCQILDIASLAPTFHAMKNLKALSVTVKEFRGSFTPPDGRVGGTPDRHSVPIDTLDLALQDRSKSIVIEPFYDYLSFLKPSTVNLSLEGLLDTDISLPRKSCLAGTVGIFPYGSTINTRLLPIDIPQPNLRTYALLTTVLRECNVAHTIHIEARTASFLTPWPTPWMIPQDDWKFFIPLRYIRLTRCDYLTEWEVHALATKLIGHARPKTGLQRLEVISCRGISVEFLLDLSEKVGSKLIWER